MTVTAEQADQGAALALFSNGDLERGERAFEESALLEVSDHLSLTLHPRPVPATGTMDASTTTPYNRIYDRRNICLHDCLRLPSRVALHLPFSCRSFRLRPSFVCRG